MRGEIPYSGDDSAGHVEQVATSTSFRTKILCRNFPLSTGIRDGQHAEMIRFHFPLTFAVDYTEI